MRSLVLYYSHSGNTARVANQIYKALQAKGDVDISELRHSDSKRYKIRHLLARVFPALTDLSKDMPDISKYDLVCVGSPVWGGKPAPLALKLLLRLRKVPIKKVIYFQIHGIKYSGEHAALYARKMLSAIDDSHVNILSITLKDARNEQKVDNMIKTLVGQIA
jgi:flavodoxin